MDFLTPAMIRAMTRHAISLPGNEVCGLLYPGAYVPLDNISASPGRSFLADPRQLAAALSRHGEPVAVFHTHPGGNPRPSAEDLASYYNCNIIIGTFPVPDSGIADFGLRISAFRKPS